MRGIAVGFCGARPTWQTAVRDRHVGAAIAGPTDDRSSWCDSADAPKSRATIVGAESRLAFDFGRLVVTTT